MKKKIFNFILNLGMITGVFYMFIPLSLVHKLDNEWQNWIYFICSVAFFIFYYIKIIKLQNIVREKYINFIDFHKRDNPVFKDEKLHSKYERLLNFTESIFDTLGYNEETYIEEKTNNLFK